MRFRHFDKLRSFVILARHLNMGSAAIELNLSKGAVSHQIQQLESELGFSLFSRAKRNLALTGRGAELFQHAQAALEGLESKIVGLRQRDSERITIGMATYFASRWLSPRLMRFISEHPSIGLRIQPLIDLTDLASNDLDLAVRWGKGEWRDKNMTVELIFRCPAMLTASQEIGRQIATRGIEPVVAEQTLLHDHDHSTAWQDWFECAGIEWSPGPDDLVIRDPNVRVQAVIDGQGIALYDFLVADEVEIGRLYQYQTVSLADYGYYLVYPEETGEESAIKIFRDWIKQEALDLP